MKYIISSLKKWGGVNKMPETEKKIMQTCSELVKRLPEREKERFLSFTEGIAYLSARMTRGSDPEQRRE